MISLYGSFATRGSDLYTITTTNFQRRTPMNVFVSLDSPEATAFIRTDPTMQGLSAEGRKKKLLDMLDAGDEYLLKYLGMTGSSARPSETTMPDSWDQAQRASTGNQDTEVAVKGVGGSPGQEYIDPNKGKKFVPPPKDFQRPGSPPVKKATSGSGDTEIARIHDGPHDSPDDVQFPGRKSKPGPGYVPPVKTVSSGSGSGDIAQSDNTDSRIDNMLLRDLERGDYGTGPNIQRQINNLLKKKKFKK